MSSPLETPVKGVPVDRTLGDHWNLFDEGVTFPAGVLRASALEANNRSMADYCRRHGVSLAPHGKTTMSPELFHMQLRAGAWAITAANVYQARVMKECGVPRVLIANEVTAPGDVAWLAAQVGTDFEVLCYVDSVAGVRILEEATAISAPRGRLAVLVELGVPGGRTGARTVDEALLVAGAVAASSSLRIAGVSGFEGIIGAADGSSAEDRVDEFLLRLVRVGEGIVDAGWVSESSEFILSAGGSVFFDRVVRVLSAFDRPVSRRIVVRSGCYISHDDGVIDELSPLGCHQREEGEGFTAALEVWAPVLSRPEPGLVVVGAGKRDVSTDGLLPVVKKWVRRGTRRVQPVADVVRATRVDDQHAYFAVPPTWDVAVGDYVCLGISHPCTTFDKWRALLIVDDDYNVVDVATTRF